MGCAIWEIVLYSLFKRLLRSKIMQSAGVGNVGMACAQTIVTQDLVKGEALDLQHTAAFLHRANILADTDHGESAGSL